MAETARKTDLFQEVARYERDPLGFVLFAFDWGHKDLEERYPEAWQLAVLASIGEQLQALPSRASKEQWNCIIRKAVSAGHTVGKSALFAWILLWGMSTCVDCRGVVTANTDTQLRTKTWATLQLWWRRCLTREWFTVTATAIHSKDPEHEKTWRVDAVPWSENNTEAFAGLQNDGKRVLILFDEASGIPQPVWDTAEGATLGSQTEIIFLVAGNATRVAGPFVETWGAQRDRWGFLRVDSRSVTLSNRGEIDKWAKSHGEDSDFFRVRVRGLPPKDDDESLISIHHIELAAARSAEPGRELVWGVDAGRGGDPSALARREGPLLHPITTYQNRTGLELAGRLNAEGRETPPAWAAIDATGIGADVAEYTTAKTAEGFDCVNAFEVWVGGGADDPKRFANIRAELYWRLIEWIKEPDSSIPNDPELIQELSAIHGFKYDLAGRMLLEPKDAIKKRIKRSPNKSDGVALTMWRPKELGPLILAF